MITLKDWTDTEIKQIIENAIEIKKNPEKYSDILKSKTMVMLFQKTSTRTRLSFEDGMNQLGGHAIFVDWGTTQFKLAGVDFSDEIKATERFADIIMTRTLTTETLTEMVKHTRTPIINGLCKKYHPCQALADVLTMVEKSGGVEEFKGKTVVWLGLANNVSNSLMLATTKLGAKFVLCVAETDPPSFDQELIDQAKATGNFEETKDLSCLKNADFVHTDTWIDMEFFDKKGEISSEYKSEFDRRKNSFMPFQLSKGLLDKYESSAKIMHCMPCHVGFEITRDAIDSPNSVIYDQAENRLHAQKALILKMLDMF